MIIFLVEDTESEENKDNVTERLAAARQIKFNQLWEELINEISQLNQVISLLNITNIERNIRLEFTWRITRNHSEM